MKQKRNLLLQILTLLSLVFVSGSPAAAKTPAKSQEEFIYLPILMGADSISSKDSRILFETFKDGQFREDYDWEHTNDAWTIQDEMLHNDGLNTQDIRYETWHRIVNGIYFSAEDYLELSLRAMLKSDGNPQEGHGVIFFLGEAGVNELYQIRIEYGFTNGPPVNPAISFCLDAGYPYQVIVAQDPPVRDRFYDVRVVRESGIWSLYVDGVLQGTSPDTFRNEDFGLVALVAIGSVVVDDITIKAKHPGGLWIARRDTAAHLPADMLATLGAPVVASGGLELRTAVESD